jgi:hypothetical protein
MATKGTKNHEKKEADPKGHKKAQKTTKKKKPIRMATKRAQKSTKTKNPEGPQRGARIHKKKSRQFPV